VGVDVGVGVNVAVAVGVGVNVAVADGDAVGVGVGVGAPETLAQAENSEVSIGVRVLSNLVAVAVTNWSPTGNGKVSGPKLPFGWLGSAGQLGSVVTFTEPRRVCPCGREWPLTRSHSASEKNSRRNVVFGTLSKVPERVTLPLLNEAEVITGSFCKSFGPVSVSQWSLLVGSMRKSHRSNRAIPRPPLEKIEFPRILKLPPLSDTPCVPLNAMIFPVPPMVPLPLAATKT
jgi:hypothetical protein